MRPFPPRLFWAVALLLIVASGGSLYAFWTHVVVPAREAARNVRCENNVFQHSGCHPSDVVCLAANGEVESVGSCPWCSTPDAPVAYFNTISREYVDEAAVSPETVDQARQELLKFKAEERYRSLHASSRGFMSQIRRPITVQPTSTRERSP